MNEKAESMNKIKACIEQELIGLSTTLFDVSVSYFDLKRIKKWLKNKAREKRGVEKTFYNKVSKNIGRYNYLDIAKEIDQFIVKKNKYNKYQFNKLTLEENKTVSDIAEQSKAITLNTQSKINKKKANNKVLKTITQNIEKNIYKIDDKNIHVYLQNKRQYKDDLNKFALYNKELEKADMKLKVHILDFDNPLYDMSKISKKKFIDSFLKY